MERRWQDRRYHAICLARLLERSFHLYYEHDNSRGQAVVERIIGPPEGQKGTACLVTDFYCGYNDDAGPQQRCWVHLLRDLRQLKDEQPSDDTVLAWARGVRQVYDDAMSWLAAHPSSVPDERRGLYDTLVAWARAFGVGVCPRIQASLRSVGQATLALPGRAVPVCCP